MKTLTAPDKTGELLRAGQVLSVTGSALVEWIASGGIKAGPIKITNGGSVGPFGTDVQLIISALAGMVSYDADVDADDLHSTNADSIIPLIASDVISGSGVLSGQALDSGQLWVTGGAGYLTASKVDNHIEGTANTYCHVDTGKKIRKVMQKVSGLACTIAIELDSSLANMVHMAFVSGAAPHCSYWKTGVGSGQPPAWEVVLGLTPDMSARGIHEFALEIIDDYAFGFADGYLIYVAYHSNFSSVCGNWFFAQLHDASTGNVAIDDKIYSVSAYASDDINSNVQPPINASSLTAGLLAGYSVQLGDPTKPGYSAQSKMYQWTDDPNGNLFGGSATATIYVKASSAGYPATIKLEPYGGGSAVGSSAPYMMEITADNSAVGHIKHGTTDCITFPNGAGRVAMNNLPTGATQPAGLLPGEFWIDTSSGRAIRSAA